MYSLSSEDNLDPWAALSLIFYWASWTSPPRALISFARFSESAFNLSHSCLRIATLFSPSDVTFFTRFSKSATFFLNYSFWLTILLNSAVNLPIWPVDNRRFSWADLTSSPILLFSAKSFWIRSLYDSDSWETEPCLFLRSLSSAFNLLPWAALSLKFYWASCTSPPRALIYWALFSAKALSRSHSCLRIWTLFSFSELTVFSFLKAFSYYWSLRFISSFYPQTALNSPCNLLIVPAESLKFYCALLTSSPILVFSANNFWIRCLYESDSWVVAPSLFLASLSSALSLVPWAALSLIFYWAYCTYPPRALISLARFYAKAFTLSHSWERIATLF